MRAAFALLGLCAGLIGCATAPAPYGPAARPGGDGYTETQIEPDRIRIAYHLNAGPQERAEDLALLRAAEVTLARGYDWFSVTQRNFEHLYPERPGPRVSIGVGGASFGSHTGVGGGAGLGFNLGGPAGGGGETALIEVRLGRGAKPADPNAYDAREVERALRPRA